MDDSWALKHRQTALLQAFLPMDDYWTIRNRQTTLRYPVWCCGVAVHSGVASRVELHPAEADSGIVFHSMQQNGEYTAIPANIDSVKYGDCRTVLAAENSEIGTTEHLLAAISALGIDNCIIKVWGSELPIFDGSASDWLFLLRCAGKVQLNQAKCYIQVLRTITVENKQAWCQLEPDPVFSLSYQLDYPHPKIGKQEFACELTSEFFEQNLARARTFGFIKDLDMLKQRKLAIGAGLENTVVFGSERVVNHGGLIWQDEPVRHKIVDAIGDLRLVGATLRGRFTGFKSGHALNHRLVKKLLSDSRNWCWG